MELQNSRFLHDSRPNSHLFQITDLHILSNVDDIKLYTQLRLDTDNMDR